MKRVGIAWIVCALTILGQAHLPASQAQSTLPHDSPSLERLRQLLARQPSQPIDEHSLHKLDHVLQDMVADSLEGHTPGEIGQANAARVSKDGKALVDVYGNAGLRSTRDLLRAAGLTTSALDPLFQRISGYLPLNQVIAVARMPQVKAVVAVRGMGADVGSVTSEGDAAHNGPAARALGSNGGGVTVGILSDSMNQTGSGVAGSQALGDLPASVNVLNDDSTGEDEGRAMAEIVYDMAPGIPAIVFSSGTASGAAGKAQAIDDLVNAGAQVIADDIYYLKEPFFQDDAIAQAVDHAKSSGVLYLASAGNRATQSYEVTTTVTNGNFHDFNPGAGVDHFQTITTVPNGSFIEVFFQWDDPWGSALNDFDIGLVNASTLQLLTSSADDNTVTGLPSEDAFWQNTTGSSVTVALEIQKFSGPSSSSRIKYIAAGNFGEFHIAEYDTASDAINPDAASARGAVTVAAVAWDRVGHNVPEPYSSRGLKTRLFDANGVRLASPDVRQKPLVAAADCVSTSSTFTGNQPFAGGAFCGTSAATPTAAGIAALMKSANPQLPLDFLVRVMTDPSNDIDCTLAGNPDRDCGYGFLLADRLVSAALNFPLHLVYIPVGIR